jgi:hypothetical protein
MKKEKKIQKMIGKFREYYLSDTLLKMPSHNNRKTDPELRPPGSHPANFWGKLRLFSLSKVGSKLW